MQCVINVSITVCGETSFSFCREINLDFDFKNHCVILNPALKHKLLCYLCFPSFSSYDIVHLFVCSSSLCSLYLYKLGIAPQIQDLLGKVDFTGKPQAFLKTAIFARKCQYIFYFVFSSAATLEKVSICNMYCMQYLINKFCFN